MSLGLLDGKSLGLLGMLKLYRVMSFWIVIYITDKAFQMRYVESVFVGDNPPPPIWLFPLYVIAAEAFAFLLVFLVLLMLEKRFKSDGNTFIVDETLLWQALTDYSVSTMAILALGIASANVIVSCGLRYSHDGLRGIRALSRMLLLSASVTLLLPFFLVY